MVTIKNKRTGKTMDVTQERWDDLRTRSRNWQYVGPASVPKPRFVKKESEKPAEPVGGLDFETE